MRMIEKIQIFMSGRYGMDELSRVMNIGALICLILSMFSSLLPFLFFFYWIFMTVLMKYTEEKWLKNLYGREYEEYCRRVNRCIPWIPKGSGGKETQI